MRIRQTQLARPSAFAIFFAAGLMLVSALAAAQDQTTPSQNSRESEGFLATVSRWFRQQTATVNSSLEDARKKVDGFNSAAGNAAKTTAHRQFMGQLRFRF